MYFSDYQPPHFHARYAEHEAQVDIATEDILDGFLPRRADTMVREWATMYRTELERNWERARAEQPLVR